MDDEVHPVGGVERESRIRQAAFAWLDLQIARGVYEFSRENLSHFTYDGERIRLADTGSGIRRPQGFKAVLSLISSTDRRTGHYADDVDEVAGTVLYRYQQEKSKRNVTANAGIRAAIPDIPIIYFQGVRDGWFVAHYPAYVTGDDPVTGAFTITLDRELTFFADPMEFNEVQRQYAQRIVRYRIHQRPFRANVLRAYGELCAVCRLGFTQLLDAAHIIRDSDDGGVPQVSNGLSLCKLHHAAYDRNMLGVSPEGEVVLSRDVMTAREGGATLHALRSLHGAHISLPRRREHRPDVVRLATRFDEFQALGA